MSHQEADKDTAVAAVLLLRAVLEVDESQRSTENVGKLACSDIGLGVVGAAKRVVVKGHTIEGRNKKQRPVTTALSDTHITIVVDGQENVRDLGEIGESRLD